MIIIRYAAIAALSMWLAPTMAAAQSLEDRIVDQLQNQGYSDVRVGRTLLGRTRIVAEGEGREREIVVNPRTGEILRDVWEAENDAGLLDAEETPETPDESDESDDESEEESEKAPESNQNKRSRGKAMA